MSGKEGILRGFLAVSFLFVLAVSAAAALRGPIEILSNGDFTPENGVISGTGAPDDPYIIAGWEILLEKGQRYGIRIENVDAHFVVRGCLVRGALDPAGAAIYVASAANGVIEDCVIRDSLNGIVLENSEGFVVRDNYIEARRTGLRVLGIEVSHFDHVITESNTVNGLPVVYRFGLRGAELPDIEAGHVTLASCRDVVLSGVKVEGGDGIHIAFCKGVSLLGGNLFRNPDAAIRIYRSQGVTIRDFERIANSEAGVRVFLSEDVGIENCLLGGNDHGISVEASSDLKFVGNISYKNGIGIYISGASKGISISRGLFYRDRIGVKFESAVDAEVSASVFSEEDIAVEVRGEVSRYRVAENTMIGCGYGVDTIGSQGIIEGNLIHGANIAIIFEEAYRKAYPTGNTVRRNLLFRSFECLYLGTETRETWVHENLFWGCERRGRDLGENTWAPAGRGNWYSDYTGPDRDGDGIGDEPVYFARNGTDPAPIVSREAVDRILGALGTMTAREVVLRDEAGKEVTLRAFVADEAHERFLGFQAVPAEWARDYTILFVWDKPVKSRFHMRNVYIPLELLLFDPEGNFAGAIAMEPDPKKLYSPEKPFSFALEIPAERWEELGLVGEVRLILP